MRTFAADDFDAIRTRLAEIRQRAAAEAVDERRASSPTQTCGNGSDAYCTLCGAETLDEAKIKCHGMCMC